MTPEERIVALGNITVARGATPEEARTAKRLARELREKHGLVGKRLKRTAPHQRGGGLPEPPRARRKRIASWWAEWGAAVSALLLGGVLALRYAALLGLIAICVGLELAGHHDGRRYVEREWFDVIFFGGIIVMIAVSALFLPCLLAAWLLRTPMRMWGKGAAAFVLENWPLPAMVAAAGLGSDWVGRTYHVPEPAAYFGLMALALLPAALWWTWLLHEEWWQAWRYPDA